MANGTWYDEVLPRTRAEQVWFEIVTALHHPDLIGRAYKTAFSIWMSEPVSLREAVERAAAPKVPTTPTDELGSHDDAER